MNTICNTNTNIDAINTNKNKCNELITTTTKTKSNTLQNPSICIPRVYDYISKWEINDTFHKLKIGKIEKIEEIYNKNTKTKRIFIHFRFWYNNKYAHHLKEIILSGGSFNVVYNFPWFWKCYKNNSSSKKYI